MSWAAAACARLLHAAAAASAAALVCALVSLPSLAGTGTVAAGRLAAGAVQDLQGEAPPADEENAGVRFSRTIQVGVQSLTDVPGTAEAMARTRAALSKRFGQSGIAFRTLGTGEMQAALRDRRLDFVVATAAFCTTDEAAQNVRAIASLWPARAASPSRVAGAVYLARASDEETKVPQDIFGKRIAAYGPDSFSGYTAALGDMKARGLDPWKALERSVFLGPLPLRVLGSLASGDTDAAILPACTIEELGDAAHLERFKVLGASPRGDALRCAHSTALYPGFYFAAVQDADEVMVQAVNDALFSMGRGGGEAEWTLPVSNSSVHDVFYELRIGPYENLAGWSFRRFMREQFWFAAFLVLSIVLILSYSLLVSMIVRARTRQLRQALREKDRMEELASASRDHIANLERAGIVGQMSTMIAHELKQPLGAITNFANGLLRRLKRGTLDEKVLEEVLTEIVAQGSRASDIVNHVRAYAKQQPPRLKMSDMSESVGRAIDAFRRSRRTSAVINRLIPPYLWADMDSWEVELAVLNLLKNAADALEGVPDARIDIRVRAEDRYWRIEVRDNGRKMTQEQVDAFMLPLVTTKTGGLGLGISIVMSIAERHHGHFTGMANRDRGVTMALDIPRAVNPEQTAI